MKLPGHPGKVGMDVWRRSVENFGILCLSRAHPARTLDMIMRVYPISFFEPFSGALGILCVFRVQENHLFSSSAGKRFKVAFERFDARIVLGIGEDENDIGVTNT